MAASKFTRNKDYSDDETNNTGGRSEVDTAGLDGEMDEIVTVTDDHADKLDLLLRDDLKMQDGILEGHEFSNAAINYLAASLNQSGYLLWTGEWATGIDYLTGNLAHDPSSGNAYICLVAHTSGTFSTDLASGYWDLYASAGATGLPAQTGHADKVLATNGASLSWAFIGSNNVDSSIATSASPTFTGNMYANSAVKTGKATGGITSGAPTYNIDFNTTINKVLSVENDATFTASNHSALSGEVKCINLILNANSGGPYTFTFPSGWKWVTAAPVSIGADATGLLVLMCYGTDDTTVVAAYSGGQ